MDDKNKTPGSLGLDDIAPASGPKGPGLGSGDFSPKDNGGPSMDPTEEKPQTQPIPAPAKNNMPPLGLVSLLLAAGALVISLWALWTTPEAMIVADGANMQPIQAQIGQSVQPHIGVRGFSPGPAGQEKPYDLDILAAAQGGEPFGQDRRIGAGPAPVVAGPGR